jgi:hypothetical protein
MKNISKKLFVIELDARVANIKKIEAGEADCKN